MGEYSVGFQRASIGFTDEGKQNIRNIPELIDYNAKFNPDHLFCVQAQKALNDGSAGLLYVTHGQLKQAILCCSRWLKSFLDELALPKATKEGVDNRKGPPIALLLDSDINLLVHVYALISLSVPALLLSARLSPAAARHLLDKTSARALIHSARLAYTAKEIREESPKQDDSQIKFHTAYDYHVWSNSMNDGIDENQSICVSNFDGGDSDRNVLILHSSGTTGLPKPIYTSHKYLLSFLTCHAFDSEESASHLNLSTLPLYHVRSIGYTNSSKTKLTIGWQGYGLLAPALSLGIGKTFCIPISSVSPTAASILRLLDSVSARCMMSVPSILEEIASLPDSTGVQKLGKLDFVAFGGGNMKPAVGHALKLAGVKLLNHFGTTESGPLAPIFIPGSDYDWQYFRLRRDIEIRVEPASTSISKFKFITYPPGWNGPFEIQDEFVTSPQNPMLDYQPVGRTDSVIVLATGEKIQPNILETALSEHPLVMAAVAFGDGHFQMGVIVQPSQSTPSECFEDFKGRIWPTVHEANERMDSHARIASKDAIIIVPHTTPLPRSDKGSLLRRELYAMLRSEIEQMYQQLESANSVAMLDRNRGIKNQLKDLIQDKLPKWNVPAQDWTFSSDLFELGMDSLQAIELRRLLLPNIESARQVPRDFIYRHPSVMELAEAIEATYREQKFDILVESRQELVDGFVERFSLQTPKRDFVILLTGSTGSLGSHVLVHLASLPMVKEVICLIRPTTNRDGNTHDRQDEALRDKLLPSCSPELRLKITTIQAVLSHTQLGLTSEEYDSIVRRVTHILHTAWPMSFKWRLSSFQSQFQTVQNLLRMALDARDGRGDTRTRNRVRFVFVSSIAVVGEYPSSRKTYSAVPETHVSDITCTNQIGYAEAKLVCEKIIERARDSFAPDLEACCVRIGQMSGSQQSGFWNTDEHIAALLKSSIDIDALPELEGTLSWLPVDVAAAALSDILLSRTTEAFTENESRHQPLSPVYHLENPIRWPWKDVFHVLASKIVQKSVNHGSQLPFVPYPTWLDRIVQLGESIANGDEGAADGAVTRKNADAIRLPGLETATTHVSTNVRKKTRPAYELVDFFAADFRRMACGSVVLDTRLALEASASLRAFATTADDAAVRDRMLEGYVDYWYRCGFLAP
ncbi:MAG: hypothetical protein Q9191_002068 [Dirinaria sp. TL-2023a]